jgi:heme/copper-type cytochrome/quinol oxidase subunit 2
MNILLIISIVTIVIAGALFVFVNKTNNTPQQTTTAAPRAPAEPINLIRTDKEYFINNGNNRLGVQKNNTTPPTYNIISLVNTGTPTPNTEFISWKIEKVVYSDMDNTVGEMYYDYIKENNNKTMCSNFELKDFKNTLMKNQYIRNFDIVKLTSKSTVINPYTGHKYHLTGARAGIVNEAGGPINNTLVAPANSKYKISYATDCDDYTYSHCSYWIIIKVNNENNIIFDNEYLKLEDNIILLSIRATQQQQIKPTTTGDNCITNHFYLSSTNYDDNSIGSIKKPAEIDDTIKFKLSLAT